MSFAFYANDAKTFLRHFSDCLYYFCSTWLCGQHDAVVVGQTDVELIWEREREDSRLYWPPPRRLWQRPRGQTRSSYCHSAHSSTRTFCRRWQLPQLAWELAVTVVPTVRRSNGIWMPRYYNSKLRWSPCTYWARPPLPDSANQSMVSGGAQRGFTGTKRGFITVQYTMSCTGWTN